VGFPLVCEQPARLPTRRPPTSRRCGTPRRAARGASNARLRGLTPHVNAGVNLIDGTFQTRGRRSAIRIARASRLERDVLDEHRRGYPLTERWTIAVDAFYSPLTGESVQRSALD